MLAECKCYTRHCKNYSGIIQPDGTEMTEANYCEAFPERIPSEIAYGDNKHDRPTKDQGNEIVYEKGPFKWETEEEKGKLFDSTLRL